MRLKTRVIRNWCLLGTLLIIFLSSLCYSITGIKESFITISVSEAKELVDNNENLFILDVRTDSEYNDGHISGAYLIPHTDISSRQEELPKNKSKPILVYCRSGGRSVTASTTLDSLGYTQVKNMAGGFDAWKDAGYPYDTGPFIKPTTSLTVNTTQSSSEVKTSSSKQSTPALELVFAIMSLLVIFYTKRRKIDH